MINNVVIFRFAPLPNDPGYDTAYIYIPVAVYGRAWCTHVPTSV